MDREVVAVSEARLSFTDAGGFLRMIPCGQILITNKARLFMINFSNERQLRRERAAISCDSERESASSAC